MHFLASIVNKKIEKIIDACKYSSEDRGNYIFLKQHLEEKVLLKKLKTKDNVFIPNQLHEFELKEIIRSQGVYYPSLKENSSKILSLLKFRIPYFVGPLDSRSDFSTAVRLEGEENTEVKPWNFEKVIDLQASAKKFIEIRTNLCTYLGGEKVLPLQSIIYENFTVLDELNKIRIDGNKLSKDIKQRAFNNLFTTYKSVSEKQFKDWLRKENVNLNINECEITGFSKDKAFASSRSNYIFFNSLIGDVETNIEMIENIISKSTMIKDERILRPEIVNSYPELTNSQVKSILSKSFDGWGRLSNELINGITTRFEGLDSTILDIMYNTDKLFMQVINDTKYKFKRIIEEEQTRDVKIGKISYEDVDNIQCSPSVKKIIWQTAQVVEELVKIEKVDPKHIFIEFSRETQDSVRTKSRKDKLQEIYLNLIKEERTPYIDELFNNLKKEQDVNLRNEILYLYYTQKGRCMYTGVELDLHRIDSYQVDHIIPRSLRMDNSINNKVLVITSKNQEKEDVLGLPIEIINKQYPIWSRLLEQGLIDQGKFGRLTQIVTEKNKEDIINGFIYRQLVETRQITKHVVSLFKAAYPNTQVISIRAQLVDQVRKRYKLHKFRFINDFHHAQDAYITAVMGQFLSSKFPEAYNGQNRPRFGIHKLEQSNSSLFIHLFSNSNSAVWNSSQRVPIMLSMLNRNDVIVTHKLTEGKGKFYNETVYGHDSDKKNLVPINKLRNDTSKYGGYSNVEKSHMLIIEFTQVKRGKEIVVKKLIAIPIIMKQRVDEYLKKLAIENGYKNLKIISNKILINQLVEVDGAMVRLSSDVEWSNAQPMLLSNEFNDALNQFSRTPNQYRFEKDVLVKIYDEFKRKIISFFPHYSQLGNNMAKGRDTFISLTEEQQVDILKKLFVASSVSRERASINDYEMKLGGSCGRLSGKNLDIKNTCFVNQSITGLYSSKVKL